ncbi:carbohydrate kinase [Halogeometricum borinquense]|uniref:Carbohydrate kinase n=1 Tax=Halogeometricum borinquense TaxID=60847 RepID=A0A6C0UF12_9EURY|nr:carbohydrate kinase [Halogeometricum borinquense]QIB73800.1 carbohydrate kinase [Halogeometricum borinquense]QIQ76842.1 carbohydrate kinase [Halogeometricum borinquense]
MTRNATTDSDAPRVVVAGEMLIDFLPDRQGPLESVASFTKRPGGAPANVAVALSQLDETPAFATRVGDDPFGDFLVETLSEAGLDTELVERDPEAKTSLAFVALGEEADRGFSFYRDRTADTRMQPGSVPDATLASADWVHVGGVTLADEPSRTATFDLMRRGRDAGATVSFDPNARPELWDEFDFEASVAEAFELADVVKATPEDLEALDYEGDPETMARRIRSDGPHTVFLTLGSEGSLVSASEESPWVTEETVVSHGGYDVEPVDTTGAGDAFTAGVVAALVEGQSLAETLSFANAVAAVTTTATGAMTALPDRESVRQFRES